MNKSVADLKVNELGVVKELKCLHDQLELKLMEMGCVPGKEVRLIHKALTGDPIVLELCGYRLSMRLSEARCIILL